MIWEPFVMALVLGIIVSAGLYFAYLWPSGQPGPPDPAAIPAPAEAPAPGEPPAPPHETCAAGATP